MNNNDHPTKGYYSLLQFVPDLERAESVNVGVVLFCPARGFLQAKTTHDSKRLRRLFGRRAEVDSARLKAMKEGFVERVALESKRIATPEDFRLFVDTRANQLLLTPPRPVKVFAPERELQALYETLVATPESAAQRTPENVRRTLERAFAPEEVKRRMRFNITVEVPAFRQPITVPYGYRNGHFNLIQPALFEAKKADAIIKQACPYAVEGHSIGKQPLPELGETQLIVVGQFAHPDPDIENDVRALLEQYNVRFLNQGQAHELAAEIVATGQLIAA
jgi:hypothetical protein